jgi:hypothetical protein
LDSSTTPEASYPPAAIRSLLAEQQLTEGSDRLVFKKEELGTFLEVPLDKKPRLG